MLERSSIGAIALATALLLSTAGAWPEDAKYPDLRGQWLRNGAVQWDPSKPPARGQQAPLTAEYQAVYDAALTEQRVSGGQDYNPQVRCIPPGMPRAMIGYEPMEILVTPEITYLQLHFMGEVRRIYTDGRDWPQTLTPTYIGTSIGRWIEVEGSGRFDALEIETRGFKGPRLVDNTGLQLHRDNQTVIKEKLYLDKANASLLRDDITLIDHALTRPWSVTRSFQRAAAPSWTEYLCAEHNNLVIIRGESFFVREDGDLMPMAKEQRPPDLRNFGQPAR
jgi:hypothetical protein